MYSVRGRFKDNFTFNLSPVTANDAKAALAYVMDLDEVKASEHGEVTFVLVKRLEGRRKVRISDKPAAARVKKAKATPAAPATPAVPAPAGVPQKRR